MVSQAMNRVLAQFQCQWKLKGWEWPKSLPHAKILLATPLIYAMIIPLLLFDLCVELYQRIVFPLIGLPLFSRREYIRLDRHRLPYLNPFQKSGCLYCGYANGLLHYASRLAAETEKVFCPIQHQIGEKFHPPAHHLGFAPYGDDKEFQRKMGIQ